jgi:hypothetical protein
MGRLSLWLRLRYQWRRGSCGKSAHVLLDRQLICGIAIVSECLRDYFDSDDSQVAYMVVDSRLKLRQDDAQLSLSLGSGDLRAQLTNAVF